MDSSLRLDERTNRPADLGEVSVEADRVAFEVMAQRRALDEIEQNGRELGAVFERTGDAFDRVGDDLLGAGHHTEERRTDLRRRLSGVELDPQE